MEHSHRAPSKVSLPHHVLEEDTVPLHRSFAVDSAEVGAASVDQITAIRSDAGGSVIYPSRTRAGYLREECLRHARARRGRGRALPLFRV